MGQTLSHGVYLPNEGERNCYAGLASNWQILNTAVGAIAEKAPLVHTHTVSQITDFPAYGNAAGTICEGNDSRLSDARTPVAHTHTKSDVTDLLNSNFIPSANNSYDLGSSSYQWNNLYAKKTYTDTVKAGTGILTLQSNGTNNSIAIHNGTAAADGGGIWLYGKDSDPGALVKLQIYNTTTSKYEGIVLNSVNFYPDKNNLINLGTSDYKWKTLNGINPGALSLPDYSRTMDIDTTNWSKDGNKIIYTPTVNGWLQITIPNDDNNGIKSNKIAILDSGTNPYSGIVYGNSNDPRIYCSFPVIANRKYWIYIKSYSNTITTARIVQCLGNV